MHKRKEKKMRLSAPVTIGQKAVLEEIAQRNDVSVARVIQEAIKEFLDHYEDRQMPLFEKPPPKG
jgi:hypothetical protein